MQFANRKKAGELLADQLLWYKQSNPIIVSIPRGGVPIGYEIAKKLHAPLSIIGVRKIGAPWNKELALGAISEQNTLILDDVTIEQQGISPGEVDSIIFTETKEMLRRVRLYRKGKIPSLRNKIVILVDDGMATGYTANAAAHAINKLGPKEILFATPVCSPETIKELLSVIDNIVCLTTPSYLESIGEWYLDFSQVSDDTVISLLEKNHEMVNQVSHQSKD